MVEYYDPVVLCIITYIGFLRFFWNNILNWHNAIVVMHAYNTTTTKWVYAWTYLPVNNTYLHPWILDFL